MEAKKKALQSISKSIPTYCSEIKTFIGFADVLGAIVFPASEKVIVAFVGIFRNFSSARKYLTAIRYFHTLFGYPITFDGPAVQQVLRGIKAQSPPTKSAPAIPPELSADLVDFAFARGEFELGLAFGFASIFLLRVPSECIPLCFDKPESHSSVRFCSVGDKEVLQIVFKSRKNAPLGATLLRECTCSARKPKVLCAVHLLRRFLSASGRPRSGRIFTFSATVFDSRLKHYLSVLGIPDADKFTSQGFRRGMAQAVVRHGGRLAEILQAGDWCSSAFHSYMDRNEIDQLAILELFDDEESERGFSDPCGVAVANATSEKPAKRLRKL